MFRGASDYQKQFGGTGIHLWVDANDLGIESGLGYYNNGVAADGWFDCDLNGDGYVTNDDNGLIIASGSYDPYHTGLQYAPP